MLNLVALEGRLVKEAEITMSKNGDSKIASFSIAVQKNKDKASFINCKAFGKTAEILEKYTSKGSMISIEGELDSGSYKKADGTNSYYTNVIVNRLHLMPTSTKEVQEKEEKPFEINSDDLPF